MAAYARKTLKGYRGYATHTSASKQWEAEVRRQLEFTDGVLTGPVEVLLHFELARPKSARRLLPSTKPDLDKLARAVLDALTGVVFKDDAQVVDLRVTKRYGTPGVHVIVVQPDA